MKMKVTKLPDSLDPNKLIEKKIREKCGTKCPFCGETKKWHPIMMTAAGQPVQGLRESYFDYIGRQDKSISSFFKERYVWRVLKYTCYTCGASWESEPFPTNIDTGDYEINA